MNREKVLRTAISKYGQKSQREMCIEEMAELTQAICKYERMMKAGVPDRNEFIEKREALVEETADVYIMIRQMSMMLGEEAVKTKVKEKIERLRRRMEYE